MLPYYAHYTAEQAQAMIVKQRPLNHLGEQYLKEKRLAGERYWTLRDLENWDNPEFRDIILGGLSAFEGGE